MNQTADPANFRRILGHYPTGVCAVTAMQDNGMPAGMVIGSFTSVSLDPPLVGFFPDRASTSWPKISTVGRFCVSVLGESQLTVCKAIASKAEDKFENIPYRLSGAGQPIIEGAIAWIDCTLHAVYDAGDHLMVLGDVIELDAAGLCAPLIFHKGGYGRFSGLAPELV